MCQCCTNALARLWRSVLGKDHKDNLVNAPGSTSCLAWRNDSKHCRYLKELLGVEKRKEKKKGHYSRYCVGNLSNVHTGLSGHHIPDPSPRTVLEREKDQTVPSRSPSISSSRLWRECEVVTVLTTGAVGGEKCRAPQEDGGQYAPLMLGGQNFFEKLASAPKRSSRKALRRRVEGRAPPACRSAASPGLKAFEGKQGCARMASRSTSTDRQ